jgi:hypothetical protein
MDHLRLQPDPQEQLGVAYTRIGSVLPTHNRHGLRIFLSRVTSLADYQ